MDTTVENRVMEAFTLTKKIQKIVVNDELYLRTLVPEDVSEPYVAWLNDYEVTKYTEQKFTEHTFDNVKAFVKQKHNSENELLFGIFFKAKHVGNLKLGPVKFEHLTAEISYMIGEKEYWGMGISSTCVRAVVNYAVEKLKIKKINAGYYENNIGSAKVLQKCDFIPEGIKRCEVLFEGQRINAVTVGYLPPSSD